MADQGRTLRSLGAEADGADDPARADPRRLAGRGGRRVSGLRLGSRGGMEPRDVVVGGSAASLVPLRELAGALPAGQARAGERLLPGRHPRCPRCRTPLCRGRIGGRTTAWCPQCRSG